MSFKSVALRTDILHGSLHFTAHGHCLQDVSYLMASHAHLHPPSSNMVWWPKSTIHFQRCQYSCHITLKTGEIAGKSSILQNVPEDMGICHVMFCRNLGGFYEVIFSKNHSSFTKGTLNCSSSVSTGSNQCLGRTQIIIEDICFFSSELPSTYCFCESRKHQLTSTTSILRRIYKSFGGYIWKSVVFYCFVVRGPP